MSRQPRLDAPATLHHVMVRGIERNQIFRDDMDRADFVAHLARLVETGAWTVYAWALLPTHAHLLVRTGTRPLPRSTRSLLTGYAGAFNRRQHRVGHLFQNRYKSIVVEEEPYLLEMVRYLHLNPLRAKVVPDLRALGRYPWTGHSALVGRSPAPRRGPGPFSRSSAPPNPVPAPPTGPSSPRASPPAAAPSSRGGLLGATAAGPPSRPSVGAGRRTSAMSAFWGAADFIEDYRRVIAAATPVSSRLSLDTRTRVCRHVGVPPMVLPAAAGL